MVYLGFGLAIVFAFLSILFIRRVGRISDQRQALLSRVGELELECAVRDERIVQSERQALLVVQQNTQSEARLYQELSLERARMKELFDSERMQQTAKFTETFQNLSNQVLENKSRSLKEQSQESISALLRPFAENIDRFRERIEQESKHRFALEKEVERLAKLNLRMSEEANNLTSALRGNSKVQGDWGEMILETLLENSGLRRDIHFRVQSSVRDGDGQLFRPDVILTLPEGKEVVIDSKVSLRAYVAYTECQDAEQAKRLLQAHSAAIGDHIKELGAKSYQGLVNSPDFVIMFVPNEPAFLLALQGDSSLWSYAYSRGVIMSSPTNLFAILRIVDELWRRDSQSKNALEIARQGGELYDKFVGFAEVFLSIGGTLDKSQEHYDRALKMLSQGKGNLTRRAEVIRNLGVKTSKSMPNSLKIDDGPDGDEPLELVD